MNELTISDWLMIVTVLIAPLLAVQAQKRLDALGEKRREKLWVFRALMATRDARLSQEHVRALNSIDLVFGGQRIFWWRWQSKKEKGVAKKWREYRDHFSQQPSETERLAWRRAGDEFFTDLLESLSKECQYDFDRVSLKRSIYSPVAFGQKEEELDTIRSGAARILRGERPFPVIVVPGNREVDAGQPPDEGGNISAGTQAPLIQDSEG